MPRSLTPAICCSSGRAALRRRVCRPRAGWAAAACAGVVFGTTLSSHLATQSQAEAVVDQAMLVGFDETEILG